MERDKALRLVETIVSTNLELVRAECGPRGAEALSDAVDSLKGLVNEIFNDNEQERLDVKSDPVSRRNRDREILGDPTA